MFLNFDSTLESPGELLKVPIAVPQTITTDSGGGSQAQFMHKAPQVVQSLSKFEKHCLYLKFSQMKLIHPELKEKSVPLGVILLLGYSHNLVSDKMVKSMRTCAERQAPEMTVHIPTPSLPYWQKNRQFLSYMPAMSSEI